MQKLLKLKKTLVKTLVLHPCIAQKTVCCLSRAVRILDVMQKFQPDTVLDSTVEISSIKI
jgi:hypothetical protein